MDIAESKTTGDFSTTLWNKESHSMSHQDDDVSTADWKSNTRIN